MAHSSKKSVCLSIWDGLDGLVRGKSASLALLSLLATYRRFMIFMRLSSFPNPGTLQEFGPLLRSKFASRTAEWFAGCPDAWHSNTLRVLPDPVEICIEVLTSKWIFIRGRMPQMHLSIWEILEALAPDNSERLCRSAGPVCTRQDVNCESLGFFW